MTAEVASTGTEDVVGFAASAVEVLEFTMFLF
jgi:hypothetical protein